MKTTFWIKVQGFVKTFRRVPYVSSLPLRRPLIRTCAHVVPVFGHKSRGVADGPHIWCPSPPLDGYKFDKGLVPECYGPWSEKLLLVQYRDGWGKCPS